MENTLTNLKIYRRTFRDEASIADDFISFIETNGSEAFSRQRSHAHITGSCWLLNEDENKVLLTHHKKLNRWLHLGGHGEGEIETLDIALREAREESGIFDVSALYGSSIFDIDKHLIPRIGDNDAHFHYDVRHLLKVDSNAEAVLSDESHALKWFSVDEIQALTSDISILRMCRKWKSIIYNERYLPQR